MAFCEEGHNLEQLTVSVNAVIPLNANMEQGGEDPTIIPSEAKETSVLVTDQYAASSNVSTDTTVETVRGHEEDPSIKQSAAIEPGTAPVESHTFEEMYNMDENIKSGELDPVVKHLDTSVNTDGIVAESSHVCAGDMKEVTQHDGDSLPDVRGGHAAEQTSVDVQSASVKHETDVSAEAGMVEVSGSHDSQGDIEGIKGKEDGLGEQQLKKTGEGGAQEEHVGGMGEGVKESEGDICQKGIQEKSTMSQNRIGDAGHPVNTTAETSDGGSTDIPCGVTQVSHGGHMTSETTAPQAKQPVTGDFISLGLQKGSSGSPKHESSKKRKKAKKRHSKDKFSPMISQIPHAFGQPAIGQPASAGLTNLSTHVTTPQMSHASHMSSEQIQTEILQIDSVLKALNMGMFDASNMATINELTSSEPKPQKVKSVGLQLIGQIDSAESSSSDSDDSSSDSSDNSMGVQEEIRERDNGDSEEEEGKGEKTHSGPRTKGEVDHKGLPPVEDCDIPFPENGQLCPIAKVIHHTESLVILESLPGAPPVDEETVLWSEERKSLTKVFETFGPVKKPYYSIRVNSSDHMSALGLTAGKVLYVIPDNQEMTKYVFTDKLMSQKGSDASWMEDLEVPAEFQEFSDDEAEKGSRVKKQDNGRHYKHLNPYRRKQRSHPSHLPHGYRPESATTYHQNQPSGAPFIAPPWYGEPPMFPPGMPHQRPHPPPFMEPVHPGQMRLEEHPPALPYQQHIYVPPEGSSPYFLLPQAETYPRDIPPYLMYPPHPPPHPPSYPPSLPPSHPLSHHSLFRQQQPPYH